MLLMLKMKVQGLMFDQKNSMAVVVLIDEEEKRSLPIWIGLFEAQAILLGLQEVDTPRPLTHDRSILVFLQKKKADEKL